MISMVTRPTSFCDVVLAKEGRTVIATKKREVVIPGVATDDGRTIRRTYDVSPEGEKILNAAEAKMHKAFKAAPKELLDLHTKIEEETGSLGALTARATPKRAKRESASPTNPGQQHGEGHHEHH